MHTQTLLKVVTIINTVKAMSFQVGKRHLCIKNAAFRISIGSFFDIKKTYLSLAFQYLSDLCSSSSITLHTEHYMYHSVKITCATHVF